MKLIIDIPDIDYEHIKEYYEKNDTVEATYSYIYHGIPLEKHDEEIIKETVESIWGKSPYTELLDKIRAEIDEQVLESLSDGGDDWFTAEKVNECLDIIDKYREEQEC